ncbi:hypothetical protein GCM10010388_65770 [Streptomyces mauvecolor]
MQEHLARSGRSLRDIRAALLTHGHLDHIGLVGTVQAAGADIWIHEADAAILTDGPRSSMGHAKPERSMLPYLLRRPAAISGPLHLARMGGVTGKPVPGARTFRGDQRLDGVPGRPRAIEMAEHTQGTVAYRFPALGVLFTGDALVTREDTGRPPGHSVSDNGQHSKPSCRWVTRRLATGDRNRCSPWRQQRLQAIPQLIPHGPPRRPHTGSGAQLPCRTLQPGTIHLTVSAIVSTRSGAPADTERQGHILQSRSDADAADALQPPLQPGDSTHGVPSTRHPTNCLEVDR